MAAAFGFSIYVTGLVFFGESNAIPFGLATWIGLGLILSYIYCYMPQNAMAKERAIEAAAYAKAEAEKARIIKDAEPDFDWESTQIEPSDEDTDDDTDDDTSEVIEDVVFDIDVDGPDAAMLDDDVLLARVIRDEEASDEDAGKPVGYSAPEGEADDLKQIKGIGPKLEQILNEMGIFHIAQIAEWGAREIAWLDENLEGFKGRATRDDWVAQAHAAIQTQEGDDADTL